MLRAVQAKGSVGEHVRQGFINPFEVERLLQDISPTSEMEARQAVAWIELLNQSFLPKNSKLGEV